MVRRRLPNMLLPLLLTLTHTAPADLPPRPIRWSDWTLPATSETPGLLAADFLLDAPAGRHGFVTCRDGHFFAGDRRIRFWGVNFTFANAFPSHGQSDATADRLARFGVNCVRFHHLDNAPFPRGIFADAKLETLSPEALDRLDYFIAALKRRGIYTNLNLHVSRWWSKAHGWTHADRLENFDKVLDIFHPDLIAANRQYARDLLSHINPYTKLRYADEPAIAMVEINNENSLFWGSESNLFDLPEPYAAELRKQWNRWLVRKYATRDALHAAWSAGSTPPGPNLLTFDTPRWTLEQHGDTARMTATFPTQGSADLAVTGVDGTDWHLQFNHPQLSVRKGQFYTLRVTASADTPTTISVTFGQAHTPYTGFAAVKPKLTRDRQSFLYGFTAPADDDNARISFTVGQSVNTIHLSEVSFTPGGPTGLQDHEDPAKDTVDPKGLGPRRARDWYAFLQYTDESYFVGMLRFLKDDLGCRQPVTGTVGYGPLGALSQSKMDFVDQHAYWDHPHFPRRSWDPADWTVSNRAMSDAPDRSTLNNLAATRVAGKPFTVTEYNHAAPNDWSAETVPMIAAFAALHDWDAVFLFDCGHAQDDRQRIRGYFDIEGNPAKMAMMPLGSRLFLPGHVRPFTSELLLHPTTDQLLTLTASSYSSVWPFVRDTFSLTPADLLSNRIALSFEAPSKGTKASASDRRISWTSTGPGTGQFLFRDDHAAVFTGFPSSGQPIDLGPIKLTSQSPFATLILLPEKPGDTLASARRLFLATCARVENTDMQWSPDRRTLSKNWGRSPTRIEPVIPTLVPPAGYTLTPLSPTGRPSPDLASPTLWYLLTRD